MDKPLRVTADSSANKKILKALKAEGLITVDYINIENAKKDRVQSENIPAFFMLGVSQLDSGDILGSDGTDSLHNEVRKLLGGGRQNYEDRRQLLGHYHSGNDVFVTGDRGDILKNREALKTLGITVVSSDELVDLLDR